MGERSLDRELPRRIPVQADCPWLGRPLPDAVGGRRPVSVAHTRFKNACSQGESGP